MYWGCIYPLSASQKIEGADSTYLSGDGLYHCKTSASLKNTFAEISSQSSN